MKLQNAVFFGLAFLLVAGGAVIAKAEDAPKGNKGFTASKSTVVDLGPQIEGMTGRELRMRMLTIEPGGYIDLHSHKDRPAVVYFMQGTDVVTSGVSSATKDTTHWHRNDGKDNVVLIAVDVFKVPAKK